MPDCSRDAECQHPQDELLSSSTSSDDLRSSHSLNESLYAAERNLLSCRVSERTEPDPSLSNGVRTR
jgi:hypothetical protein